MRGLRIAQLVVGASLLSAALAMLTLGSIGWSYYTPTSTRTIEIPIWPGVAVLAGVLASLVFGAVRSRRR